MSIRAMGKSTFATLRTAPHHQFYLREERSRVKDAYERFSKASTSAISWAS
jgi:hypothetical protein